MADHTTDHTQQPMAQEPHLPTSTTPADTTLPLITSPLRPWVRIPHPSPHVVHASNQRGARCSQSCISTRLPHVRSLGCRTTRPPSTRYQIPAIISASYLASWTETNRSTLMFSMTLPRAKNPITHTRPLSSSQSTEARGRGSLCKRSTRPSKADLSGSRIVLTLHGRCVSRFSIRL